MCGWLAANASSGPGLSSPGGAPTKPNSICRLRAGRASTRAGARRVQADDRGAGLLEERLTGRRQRDAARVALEQHDSDVGLELGDRLRERGLRDVELARGARHLPLFGDGHEVDEMASPEFHRSPPAQARGSLGEGRHERIRVARARDQRHDGGLGVGERECDGRRQRHLGDPRVALGHDGDRLRGGHRGEHLQRREHLVVGRDPPCASYVLQAVERAPIPLDVGVETDEGLLEHVRHADLRAPAEGVVAARHDRPRLAHQRLHDDAGFGARAVADGDIHLGEPARRRAPREGQVLEVELGVGIRSGEGLEQLRQGHHRRRADEPDGHRAPRGARASDSAVRAGRFRRLWPPRALSGRPRRPGVSVDAAAMALQHCDPQFRTRAGRSPVRPSAGRPQPRRRAGDLALFGDGAQVVQCRVRLAAIAPPPVRASGRRTPRGRRWRRLQARGTHPVLPRHRCSPS